MTCVAQQVVGHIQPHSGAAEGVAEMDAKPVSLDQLQAGDLVVSRTTAPVVNLAYRLLKEGRRAQVLGRDIGKGLVSLVNRLKASSVADLLAKLTEWNHKEEQKLKKQDASEARRQSLADRVACLRALAPGCDSVQQLLLTLDQLFAPRPDAGSVTLCTVHKSKGLEADRVWVVDPHTMPHSMAKQPWQMRQELNLIYVAVTRAKRELRALSTSGPKSAQSYRWTKGVAS